MGPEEDDLRLMVEVWIAGRALLYQELSRLRYQSKQGFIEHVEEMGGESPASLIGLLAMKSATELDFAASRAMERVNAKPGILLLELAELSERDNQVAEAMAHALDEDPRPSGLFPSGVLDRWDAIEEHMYVLRTIGLTETAHDLREWTIGDGFGPALAARLEGATRRYIRDQTGADL